MTIFEPNVLSISRYGLSHTSTLSWESKHFFSIASGDFFLNFILQLPSLAQTILFNNALLRITKDKVVLLPNCLSPFSTCNCNNSLLNQVDIYSFITSERKFLCIPSPPIWVVSAGRQPGLSWVLLYYACIKCAETHFSPTVGEWGYVSVTVSVRDAVLHTGFDGGPGSYCVMEWPEIGLWINEGDTVTAYTRPNMSH